MYYPNFNQYKILYYYYILDLLPPNTHIIQHIDTYIWDETTIIPNSRLLITIYYKQSIMYRFYLSINNNPSKQNIIKILKNKLNLYKID